MKYILLLSLILYNTTCDASPNISYSTIINDSTYYHELITGSGTEGQLASDVDPEGNFYVGVPIFDPLTSEICIKIYRINNTGNNIDTIGSFEGFEVCNKLIWSEFGIYVHLNHPKPSQILKIDFQGNIEYAVNAYRNVSQILVNDQGYLYILAIVNSLETPIENIPITPNAFDPTYNGLNDILIQKYDVDGNIVYGSFIGGSGNDSATKFTMDNEGRLFIAGSASINISNSHGGEINTVVINPGLIVISPDFNEIHAYGSPNNYSFSLSVPYMFIHNHKLFMPTYSTLQKYNSLGEIISILSLSGVTPEFTWPPQKSASHPSNKMISVFMDNINRIYSIHYKSADAPFTTTSDALYAQPNTGDVDLGIWQITDNAELLYGTYFGGSGIEETTMNAVAFRNGKLYVAGYTNSPDFPLTPGAHIDIRTHPYPSWGLFAFCIDFNEPTDVAEESSAIPEALILDPPHPNPFNPATTISFTLPEAGLARLAIYNISGQLVRELSAGNLPAGQHEIVWDGHDTDGAQVGSGVYIARLMAGDRTAVRKVTLVR